MRGVIVAIVLLSGLAAACASSADAPEVDTPAANTPAPTVASTSTTEDTPPAAATPSASAEARGVVGAVDEVAGVIEIRATGGGPFTRIEVAPGARITLATGGSLSLDEIRPSDRLSASGTPGDDPDTLLADRIEISRVVPGAAPGG